MARLHREGRGDLTPPLPAKVPRTNLATTHPQTFYAKVMPTPPKKLRKRYENTEYPYVILRFEDGHEIQIRKGSTKSFDCYSGETIKVLAVYDTTSGERELVKTRKADAFADE